MRCLIKENIELACAARFICEWMCWHRQRLIRRITANGIRYFAKLSSHGVPLTINSLVESWMTLKSSPRGTENFTLDKRNYAESSSERSQMTRSVISSRGEFSGELNLRPKFQGFSFTQKKHRLPQPHDKEEENHRKQQDLSELAQCTEARREIAFSTRGWCLYFIDLWCSVLPLMFYVALVFHVSAHEKKIAFATSFIWLAWVSLSVLHTKTTTRASAHKLTALEM